MTETETFIEIVRQYPVLYNLSHREYKNIKNKDKIWDNIAKDLGGTGEELKKKWKNLRDSYSKYLRSEKTHTGQEMKFLDRYKTWPWANQMEFFRPFLQFSKTASNVANQPICNQQDGVNENNEDGITDKGQDKIANEPLQDQHEKNPASQPVRRETPTTSRKRKSEETGSVLTPTQQVLNYLQARHNNINSDHTDIDLIFMGYAKTVQKFSPRRQAMVKFKFSQILLEEELAQQEENEQNRHEGMNASASDRPTSSASSLAVSESTPSVSDVQRSTSSSWYEDFGSSLDTTYQNI